MARTEVQHQVGLQGAMRMTQDQLPAENQAKCISQHLQLRTVGFCWCKVLLPACPCWRQQCIHISEKSLWSSPQQCYLHCLHILPTSLFSSTRVSLSLRKVNIQWVLIASPHQENPTILQPHFDLKVDIIKKTEYSIVSYCQMSAGVTRIRGQIRRQIHTQ